MLATSRAHAALIVHAPTAVDAHILAEQARDAGCGIHAHPRLLDALHARVAVFGPIIARTSLAAILDVDVTADDTIPEWGDGGVVLLVPAGAPDTRG